MLIIGGLIFILIEYIYKTKKTHINSIDNISYTQAFLIGLFQSLAMVPGTSRSGATIIGGLILGLNREVAAKFSFLLAVPTMLAATAYDTLKHYELIFSSNMLHLSIGFFCAFFSALIAIKLFLHYISKYNFIPFAIYRIIIGSIFLFILL